MAYGVLGSGFGLYGYFPAIVRSGLGPVILPERYRATVSDRAELACSLSAVRWVADDEAVLAGASRVIIARRPQDQPALVTRCLAHDNIQGLILEKPLAPTPAQAAATMDVLAQSRTCFRIGYTFRHTAWALRLADRLSRTPAESVLTVRWEFLAHHFRSDLHNWKRAPSMGGGALRFYGIHLLALLAEMGYTDIASSAQTSPGRSDGERWEAVTTGQNVPICQIIVDTRATTASFAVGLKLADGTEEVLVDLDDPFATTANPAGEGGDDRRVIVLSELLRDLENGIAASDHQGEAVYLRRYQAIVELWRQAEMCDQKDIRNN